MLSGLELGHLDQIQKCGPALITSTGSTRSPHVYVSFREHQPKPAKHSNLGRDNIQVSTCLKGESLSRKGPSCQNLGNHSKQRQ